jgi:hypothetical protein
MATDLTVVLEDRPGTLAALGAATANAGVNMDGICGFSTAEGEATMHVLVEDAAAGRSALEAAGLTVSGEREVVVLDVEDRPGAVKEIAHKVAEAGVNIELVYLATNTRLVLAAADLGQLQEAVG